MDTKLPNNLQELLKQKYGEKGSESRELFEAKAMAYYYCELLKEARKSAQLTQNELAEETDLKKSFISRVENGKVDVQLSTFIKLLDGIGLELRLVPKTN